MCTDEETQQTIIAGMGELHLEIIVDRLRREFKVEANVGKPQVAYKEADHEDQLRSRAVSSASPAVRVSTATSGCVSSRNRRARASSSRWKIVGGAVPKEYVEAVQAGRARVGAERRARRLPGARLQSDGFRRFVPRRRLVAKWRSRSLRSMAWKEANRAAGPILSRADHEGRSDDARRVSSARSSATSPRVAARFMHRRGRAGRRADDHRDTFRSPRCSATRPTCAPRRKGARRTRWSSRTTRRLRTVEEEIVAKAGRDSSPRQHAAQEQRRYRKNDRNMAKEKYRAQ